MIFRPWHVRALLRLRDGKPLFEGFATKTLMRHARRAFVEYLKAEGLAVPTKQGLRLTPAGERRAADVAKRSAAGGTRYQLRELAAVNAPAERGETYRAISRATGIEYRRVTRMAEKLGFPSRVVAPRREWTSRDCRVLMEHSREYGRAAMAERFGVSRRAIDRKLAAVRRESKHDGATIGT